MTFIATKLFHKAGEGSGGGGGGDQHNLGWYATESALTTAHPTATAGDWAIVGSTDTVWLWDTDNEEWVDSDQKGQVTSVNGQTGDVVLDLLPDQTGNAGKFLTTDGTDASWSHTVSKNVLNYRNEIDVLTLKTVSGIGTSTVHIGTMENDLYLHPAIGGNIRCFSSPYPKSPTNSSLGLSTAKWERTYTTKLNNGNDITVPAVAGEMAVIQVNTTITLAAANWSSNTQTVSVSGVSSTSVVFVAPDPADTTDYVSAGILCTSQGTNSLTFTATTTPSADIDVVVVAM